MQTGSLPVWVTLVVAGVGFLGLIAAQLINAWREDRRLKSELTREQARWDREDHANWRVRRLDTYREFLDATAEWELAVLPYEHYTSLFTEDVDVPKFERTAEMSRRESECFSAAINAHKLLELVGSPEVQRGANSLMSALTYLHLHTPLGDVAGKIIRNWEHLPTASADDAARIRDELVDLMRSDLRLDK